MSRLIVKNLPKGITEEKLQQVFGAKGVITDVQLKYTKDGKFRHFAFIGFKKEEEAENAKVYFNNTFINASRITVETCVSLGDPSKPKAWSKYAPDSSASKKDKSEPLPKKEVKKRETKSDIVQDILKKYEKDHLFLEYLEAHSKDNNGIWKNGIMGDINELRKCLKKKDTGPKGKNHPDEHLDHNGNSSNEVEDKEREEEEEKETDEDMGVEDNHHEEKVSKLANVNISDLEYLKTKMKKSRDKKGEEEEEDGMEGQEAEKKTKKIEYKKHFFNVKLKGIKFNSKKRNVREFLYPLKPCSIRLPPKMKGIAFVGFSTEKEMKEALRKNCSFLGGRKIFVTRSESYIKNSLESTVEDKWKSQEDNLKNEESVGISGRIYVRNLPYNITEEELEKLFKKYGPLTEVNLPVDRVSRKVKGFATITYLMPEHAVRAYTELDGSIFQGRMLHLLPGKEKKSIEELLEMEGLPYKQKKALKMKLEAASSHNWNTLFLGQNAVVDLIAKNYNTSKDQVLDAHGNESLAVRLALGETEIVSQTKTFLEENGVHLNAFNQISSQRSKTVILVKNLPADTQHKEIHQLFSKFGELGRVLLPPSGVTAIVEFLEPSESRTAFKKLAYTKFKNLPLYLEWAPHNAFATPYEKKEKSADNLKSEETIEENDNPKEKEKDPEITEDEEENDEPPEADTVLFIKNLKFETKEDAIRKHFEKCGPIHYVIIAKKKDPKKSNEFLSLGYGFIQFKKKASADKALKSYQHSVLDGHSLELKRSNRTLQSDVADIRKKSNNIKQTSSKILVRNVPFQATTREVRDLFKTFGEIKALRLPLKMAGTGSHRGFAFVEYYTKHDAKRAFRALCQSTHLYGRRLNLEWAATEENVDELRQKTARLFAEGPSHYAARKGFADLEIEERE